MYIYIYKLYIQCMVDGNCDVAKIDGMNNAIQTRGMLRDLRKAKED